MRTQPIVVVFLSALSVFVCIAASYAQDPPRTENASSRLVIANATNDRLTKKIVINGADTFELAIDPGSVVTIFSASGGVIRLQAHLDKGINRASGRYVSAKVLATTVEVGMSQKSEDLVLGHDANAHRSISLQDIQTVDLY